MSKLLLIIGNKNYSSWSLRPWVFLKQFKIEFEEKRIALFTETTDNELSEYGSDFKVPVLKDGELTLWDSLSILEYLSENHLDSNGWPLDSSARAIARSVSAEMHSSFINVRNELPMNCRKTFQDIQLSLAAKKEVERIKFLWRTCRAKFGTEGEWLFGAYSIADAMFSPIALRFAGYNIPLDGIEKAYVNSVLNQPCIKEWIEAGKLEKEVIDADEIEYEKVKIGH
jgi:glutathione S-transferase